MQIISAMCLKRNLAHPRQSIGQTVYRKNLYKKTEHVR